MIITRSGVIKNDFLKLLKQIIIHLNYQIYILQTTYNLINSSLVSWNLDN